MKLITREIEKTAPALYATEDVPADEKKIVAKFFTPTSSFTWYMVEYDPTERRAFGFVTSHMCPDGELGYFSISELESVRGPFGVGVERDMYYGSHTLQEVIDGDPSAR